MLRLLLLLVYGLAAAFGGFTFANYLRQKSLAETEEKVDITMLQNKMEQVSELASCANTYTTEFNRSRSAKVMGFGIWGTKSTLRLSYTGVIKAGVDLGEAKIEKDQDTIYFILPEPKIISHDVDPKNIKFLEQDESIWTSFTLKEFNEICATQRDSMEQVALQNGILEKARESAVESMGLIVDPLIQSGVTVVIRQANGSQIKKEGQEQETPDVIGTLFKD